MSLESATLAHRRALLAYEELATRALVRAYVRPLADLLKRLAVLDEWLSSGRPLTARQRDQAARDRRKLIKLIKAARTDARGTLQTRLRGAAQTEQRVSVSTLTAGLPEGREARAPGIDLQQLLLNPTAGQPWTRRLDVSLKQTYDRIDAALLVAIDRGASMDRAAELVRLAVGADRSQRNSLRRLTRTEIQRVANQAAQATYAANRDVVRAVRYLATLDARTCPVCRPDHQKVFELAEDGSHKGPPIPRHPNCFPAGVVVSGPRAQAATRRWYEGQLIELETADGRHIPVTPNHPMLTTRGWIAAGELHEGDDLIHCPNPERLLGGDPHNHLAPSRIEEVAGALREASDVSSMAVPLAAEDFHGDGFGGEVDIVRADCLLIDRLNPTLQQHRLEVELSLGDVQPLLLPSQSAPDFALNRVGGASSCVVCGSDVTRVLFRAAPGHHQPVGFNLSSSLNTLALDSVGDQGPRSSIPLRESVDGYPIPIELQKLIQRQVRSGFAGSRLLAARRSSSSGHVYNLQTTRGWYAANGIITHNCRCFYAPVTRSFEEILAA